jgi:hypothetical protein
MSKSFAIPKLFFTLSWVVVVALCAFLAGRWTAPDEATTPPNVVLNDHELTSAKPSWRTNAANSPAPVAVNLPHKPSTAQGLGKPSYATDYQFMQQLIALAATNPQLAMEQALSLKGALKVQAQTAILAVWGGVDPSAAWNWVVSFQPDNNAQFISLLEVIGRREPRTAMAFAEKFVAEHRELRKDIYAAALAGITQAGAYSLGIDWLEGLELEAETKAELRNFVVSAWAPYEPQAAMQWVLAQPEQQQAAAIDRLSESWSDTDPQAAVNFAANLNSGAKREALLLSAFKKWLSADSAAASSWLASAQLHKDFDPLISEFATQPSVNNGQVKAALDWAGKVHDPELRLSTVTSILSAFKQKDPSAASAYLQDIAYLSDAERTQLREDLAFGH